MDHVILGEEICLFVFHQSNKFLYLMRRHICARYMAVAYVFYIYTHMPYTMPTFEISSQLTHTHSFIVSAYLNSIVWYIRFMYGDLAKVSHQSYRFTAKSWGLFTYHLDRAIISATWVILYRPTGPLCFCFECMSEIMPLLLAESPAFFLPINFTHSHSQL